MYSEPLADGRISIHDCIAQRMTLEKGILTFAFPEGIWVIPGHPSNPTENMVRTGPARMELELYCDGVEDFFIQTFYNLRYPWRLCRWWDGKKFQNALNSGRFQLEFISWYAGYVTIFFQCSLPLEHRPWHRDCTIQLDAKNIVCHWETMNFNRVW